MPFKTYEELMDMSKKDPKMAMMLVNRAKSSGKPVVDENNPGYGPVKKPDRNENPRMNALKRRMQKMTPEQTAINPDDQTQNITARRKNMGY